MHVGAVGGGAGATPPDPLSTGGVHGHARAPANPEATPPPSSDSVASFLGTGKIADLISSIDRRRPVQNPEVIAELMRAAVSAAEEKDFVRALEKARELVAMDPERADTLESEPGLESIRTEISQLLRELSMAARSDAEQKLAGAQQALASDGARLSEGDRADLRTVLSVAVQLFETGRPGNYVRAGDLAEVVMVQCGWTPSGVPVWVPVEVSIVEEVPGRRESLWQRAPLPILVLAWLALGIAGALPFAVVHVGWPVAAIAVGFWGIGFFVLVRWYRRARRARLQSRMLDQAAETRRAT